MLLNPEIVLSNIHNYYEALINVLAAKGALTREEVHGEIKNLQA
jgi:hypothetical protein